MRLHKGQLNSYLSGRYKPKQDKIYLLAYALNVNPDWLYGLDVPMEPNCPSKTDSQCEIDMNYNVLSKDEEELIDLYRKLKLEDKAEVRGYIKGIIHTQN